MFLGEEHLELELLDSLELGVLSQIVEIMDHLTATDLSKAPASNHNVCKERG